MNFVQKIKFLSYSLLLLAVLWACAPEQTSSSTGSLEGKPAPDFTLRRADGQPVRLGQYRGKVVFLNFWATWCEPCKQEMPAMQSLYKKLQGKPFEMLAVSLDQSGKSAVESFLKAQTTPLTFPILYDSEQGVSKKLYRTTGVPETFVIDSKGQVIKHVMGAYEWDNPQIVAYFQTLLKNADLSGQI